MAGNEVIKAYKRVADKYDALVEDHMESIWESILGKLNISENSRILDLGCGTGRTLHRIMSKYKLPKLRLEGVDLSPEMINMARRKCGEEAGKLGCQLNFQVQDCMEYLKTCEEDRYDLVIASFLLAYVRASKPFSLVGKILKKGGKFIVLTTDREAFKEDEKNLYKFAISRFFYLDCWTLMTQKVSLVPPIEKIIRMLYKAEFSRVESTQTLIKITFGNPLEFLKWLDESGWGTRVFDWIKKGKKEFIMNEIIDWAQKRDIRFCGEVFRMGEPFRFNWPIYTIIAVK